MTETQTLIRKADVSVGDVFGYREVVEITTRNVSYRNLNGRPTPKSQVKPRPVHTLTWKDFLALVN